MAQLRNELQKKSEELANVQQVLRETEQEETNLREQVAEMKKELDLKVFKPIPGIMHAVLSSSDQIILHVILSQHILFFAECCSGKLHQLQWSSQADAAKTNTREGGTRNKNTFSQCEGEANKLSWVENVDVSLKCSTLQSIMK